MLLKHLGLALSFETWLLLDKARWMQEEPTNRWTPKDPAQGYSRKTKHSQNCITGLPGYRLTVVKKWCWSQPFSMPWKNEGTCMAAGLAIRSDSLTEADWSEDWCWGAGTLSVCKPMDMTLTASSQIPLDHLFTEATSWVKSKSSSILFNHLVFSNQLTW